ncbi:hypothetical protein ACCS75_36395, partial [Rhizobium ruizarguesonis]
AYRLAGTVASPVVGLYITYRTAKGKEDRARRLERFGYPSANRPQGPLIWFHAFGRTVGDIEADDWRGHGLGQIVGPV